MQFECRTGTALAQVSAWTSKRQILARTFRSSSPVAPWVIRAMKRLGSRHRGHRASRIDQMMKPRTSQTIAAPIEDEALPIARQIAEALEAAHERGIVHPSSHRNPLHGIRL